MCSVYVACKMTGRDKAEMVKRAKYVSAVLKQFGLTPISPVIEEGVDEKPGPLVNDSKQRLAGHWARDKHIIRYQAHVILVDGADAKSFGVERELGLMRYCLWKPVVLVMPDQGITVATMEDDYITNDIFKAAEYIRDNWGTRRKRWLWRIKMLTRTLPRWVWGQIMAWR